MWQHGLQIYHYMHIHRMVVIDVISKPVFMETDVNIFFYSCKWKTYNCISIIWRYIYVDIILRIFGAGQFLKAFLCAPFENFYQIVINGNQTGN